MTGPRVKPLPMQVSHTSTDVIITVPSDLARDIAAAWSMAHCEDPILSDTRPDWINDVLAVMTHAALCDQEASGGPALVEVPVLNLLSFDRPRLEAVPSC